MFKTKCSSAWTRVSTSSQNQVINIHVDRVVNSILFFLCLCSQAEASFNRCHIGLIAIAVGVAVASESKADIVISDSLFAQDRILFEPSIYYGDPNRLIDFRQPQSWLFEEPGANRYYSSNSDYFSSSSLSTNSWTITNPGSMPLEAAFGVVVDYSQEGNPSNVYSYLVYDYSRYPFEVRVTRYVWTDFEYMSGPRPIILYDDPFARSGGFVVPAPATLSLLALSASVMARRRR